MRPHQLADKRKKRAYVIADNELALNAGWDEDLLTGELRVLLLLTSTSMFLLSASAWEKSTP